MATDKQVAANRQNAARSTGPRTEPGKRRSRRNAFRHGLTAETVIDGLEDPADYQALEAAINADYRPRTAFELELVARLSSLLWRLRRAIAIEMGLLKIQAKALRRRNARNCEPLDKEKLNVFYDLIPSLAPPRQTGTDQQSGTRNTNAESHQPGIHANLKPVSSNIARSYLRLANHDNGAFERLGRYETSLWRQTVQIILLLNSINGDANDRHANFTDKFTGLRNVSRYRRPIRWPPFIPFR